MTTEPTSQHHDLTYGDYLKIDELLALQQCRSRDPETGEPEHDETLFIIIHQVYELWFKQVLHELDAFAGDLDADAPYRGSHRLGRVLKILKTLVAQLDVLETMTPLEFSSFRSFLADSSGFQSAQFRELEFALGQKTRDHLDRFAPHPGEFDRLTRRYLDPTIWDHFVRYVDRCGFAVPTEVLERDVTLPVVESSGVQDVLIDIYRTDPALTGICEALTDLDEGVQEWGYRHVMMVQRTIGAKIGTGGSRGAAYLRETLFRPAFPDLWAVRSRF
ncbi:MAG: tryptophan 2,3-dioxygenase family protein [Acidimicrobiia bacterium]|nr:tryptophan 2,3-dioxygenase family protein [Acidimicrobiia bacterium]